MGSSVTICNRTEVPLNVALRQLTPLYFENGLKPDEEMVRDVGKVWFTVEVKMQTDWNNYKISDSVLPIGGLATGFSLAAGSLGCRIGRSVPKRSLPAHVTLGHVARKFDAMSDASLKHSARDIKKQLVEETSSSWHGLYIKSDKRYEIHGGSRIIETESNGIIERMMDETTLRNPFKLFEVTENGLLQK